jgi:hypothetical protein
VASQPDDNKINMLESLERLAKIKKTFIMKNLTVRSYS